MPAPLVEAPRTASRDSKLFGSPPASLCDVTILLPHVMQRICNAPSNPYQLTRLIAFSSHYSVRNLQTLYTGYKIAAYNLLKTRSFLRSVRFQDRCHQPLGQLSDNTVLLQSEHGCGPCSLSTWTMVMLTFPGTRPAPSLRSVGINEYLAGLARFQASHGLREIFHRDAVCNHRMKIEASAF
jgi:hypothetical protein